MRLQIAHLHKTAFLAARRVGLPCPENASLGQIIDRDKFRLLHRVSRSEVYPNRQDTDLSFGGLQDTIGHDSRKCSFRMRPQRIQVI